jgi:hypothetical protein
MHGDAWYDAMDAAIMTLMTRDQCGRYAIREPKYYARGER